jgi:hypothetical protein
MDAERLVQRNVEIVGRIESVRCKFVVIELLVRASLFRHVKYGAEVGLGLRGNPRVSKTVA